MLKKIKLIFIDYRTFIEKGRERKERKKRSKQKRSKNEIDMTIVICVILYTKATS